MHPISKMSNVIHVRLTTWMGLKGILLSEINQAEKNKYHMISLIYGIFKKTTKQTKKQNKQRNQNKCIDTENTVVVARREGGKGSKWVKGVNFMVMDGNETFW